MYRLVGAAARAAALARPSGSAGALHRSLLSSSRMLQWSSCNTWRGLASSAVSPAATAGSTKAPVESNLGSLSARVTGPQVVSPGTTSGASSASPKVPDTVKAVSTGFGPRRITPSRVPISKRAQAATPQRPPVAPPGPSSPAPSPARAPAAAPSKPAAPTTLPTNIASSFEEPVRRSSNQTADEVDTSFLTAPARFGASKSTAADSTKSFKSPWMNPWIPVPLPRSSPAESAKPVEAASASEEPIRENAAEEDSQFASAAQTGVPDEATTSAAPVVPQPFRAQKLTPEELRKKFPFTKNLSAVQPARVVDDNKYFHERWFMTEEREKQPPPEITEAARDLPEVYIARANQLPELCKYLARTPIVAVDTEFFHHNVYRPTLQVIQIATSELLAAVDVQLLGSTPEFKAMLEQLLEKEWVLHSHRGDLEVIYDIATKLQLKRVTPPKVFDTQVAIAFLSPTASIGYAGMLQDLLGLDVDKTSSLSDWSRRPLTVTQIEYALQDVKYLLPIKLKLEKLLKSSTIEHNALLANSSSSPASTASQHSRLAWFEEEMSLLSSPSLYAPLDPSAAGASMHSRKRFDAGSLERKIFDRLSEWREKTASARDALPVMILTVDNLVALSLSPPRDMDELILVLAYRRFVVGQHGDEILKVIQEARAEYAAAALFDSTSLSMIPEDSSDHFATNRTRFELMGLLAALMENRAGRMGISSYVLAPRRDRADLAALSIKAIKQAAQWKWQGVQAQDGEQKGFWPSLQPASVNYRFAAGITEQTVFERLLLGGQTETWLKEAGVGKGQIVLDAAKGADSSAPSTALLASRPLTPLSYSTELTLLRFSKLLRGWRREVIGEEILDLLEGRKTLRWEWTEEGTGKLVVQDVESGASTPIKVSKAKNSTTKAKASETSTANSDAGTESGSPTSAESPPVAAAAPSSETSAAAATPSPADAPAPKKKRAAAKSAEDKAAEKAAKQAEKEKLAAEKAEQKRLAAEAKGQAKLEKLKAKEAQAAAKKSTKK